mgnify:CR=1 FL=1
MALFKGSKESTQAEGESSAECMRIGQSLVEADQLTAENYAAALATANGDLLAFADALLARHGVGRTELAIAISQATGVPAVDTKGDARVLSRLGVSKRVDLVVRPDESLLGLLQPLLTGSDYSAVFVDEAQFFSRDQIDQLMELVVTTGVPVLAYGAWTLLHAKSTPPAV